MSKAKKKTYGKKPRTQVQKDTPLRPPLSEEMTTKICNMLRRGSFLETAAASMGVQGSVLKDWLHRGNALLQDDREDYSPKELLLVQLVTRVHKALADGENSHLHRIDNAAKLGDWKASAWVLTRGVSKKKFAPIKEHEHTLKGEVNVTSVNAHVHLIDSLELPLEQRKQLLAVIRKKREELTGLGEKDHGENAQPEEGGRPLPPGRFGPQPPVGGPHLQAPAGRDVEEERLQDS